MSLLEDPLVLMQLNHLLLLMEKENKLFGNGKVVLGLATSHFDMKLKQVRR